MTHEEITNGLSQLGFTSGWVVNDEEIVLWENSEPQPTKAAILEASKQWTRDANLRVAEKNNARAAILDRLGLTADEAAILLG